MRSEREKVAFAVCGSVLLHGIALGLFGLIVALQPPAPPDAHEDEPLNLEVLQEPPDTPPPVPEPDGLPTPTPTPQRVVDATGEDTTDTPSPDAAISDRTTRASSAETGDGKKPGPAQSGRRLATFEFDPQPPAPGLVDRATPAPPTAPEPPQPDRFTRQPPAALPTPAATPVATPAPTAAPDEFAMAMATPTPTPEDPFDPSIRSTSPPLPRPAARATPTPKVGSIRSAENGAGARRGPGGIDTVATPAGRYTRQVTGMIKFIWSRSIDSRSDLTYGATVIHLTIDKDGLVIAPRIVSNTSDPVSGATALQAVVVARLPPMPPDVIQELGAKKLTLDITFDYLPVPQEAAQR